MVLSGPTDFMELVHVEPGHRVLQGSASEAFFCSSANTFMWGVTTFAWFWLCRVFDPHSDPLTPDHQQDPAAAQKAVTPAESREEEKPRTPADYALPLLIQLALSLAFSHAAMMDVMSLLPRVNHNSITAVHHSKAD